MSRPDARPIGRRQLLIHLGRGAVGIAVLGLAACNGRDADTAQSTKSSDPTSALPSSARPTGTATGSGPMSWTRVDLGFVAAYVLVRGREAAVVDTGVGGSADEIGAALTKAGPGWGGVRHVVLTHKHGDHAGSIGDVLARAPRATGYAGAADLGEIDAPRRLQPLGDGDEVFGLKVVATPGHTRGHIAVHDVDAHVLVAGDALTNTDGLAGSNPAFTEDRAAAVASVRLLARLRPSTILVGHGPPLERGAAAALERLAQSLR